MMKVIKPDEVPAEPANSPLFTGGTVTRQPLLTSEMSQNFNLGIVHFAAGARNKMHTHTSDQVLFVTEGTGVIATETTEEVITVGDVVHIPAEEKHWHGATAHSSFAHIALTAKGSQTTQVEE
jgi:quercetin dioxygenase-like cupin family protein